MTQILLTVRLRQRQDALRVRQRARQLAGLLGYDITQQATFAAGVFAIAWQILQLKTPLDLCFALENNCLRVFSQLPEKKTGQPRKQYANVLPALQIQMLLPPQGSQLAVEDLIWTISNLEQLTPSLMYEEIYRQNQELLATLHALRECQAILKQHEEKPGDSSAA